MAAQQFKLLTGFYGFDIVSSGTESNGNWYAIQLFGINDGANVSYSIDGNEECTLTALGANIPNGLIIYGKFTSIMIDSAQQVGSAIMYRLNNGV